MEALNKLETQYEWNCKGEYGGASVTCHACTAETVWNPATKSCDTRQYGLEICRHKGDLSAFLLQRRWKPSEACETLPQKYTKDQPLNLQTPKLTGHTFYGRSTDPSCQGTKWSSSSPFVREENTKLYACRHPNTYQIHYDKQGGQRSSAPDTTSKQVTYGEIIGELRRDIVKENHTFTDWYDHTNGTSGTGKVYQTNQRYTVPGDSTAYAAWTPNLPTPQNPQSAGTGRLQLYLCDPEGNYVFTEKIKPAGTKEEIKATQYQLIIYLDPQG